MKDKCIFMIVMFIIGLSTPSIALSYFVAIEDWYARYDGPFNGHDWLEDSVIDDDNNIFVTGFIETSEGPDCLTVKYDNDGNIIWESSYDSQGNRHWDYSLDIAIDLLGNTYITGWTEDVKENVLTIKYDDDGNEEWVRVFDATTDYDRGKHIIADYLNNIYVVGLSLTDIIVLKYDTNGNMLWNRRYDGTGHDDDDPLDVVIDSANNLYITGRSKGDGTYFDSIILKYSPSGNLEDEYRYDGGGGYTYETSYAIAIDSEDMIYVSGAEVNSNDDCFVIKYNTITENVEWLEVYNGASNQHDSGKHICIDNNDKIIVTGYTGPSFSKNVLILKYDENGNLLWEVSHNSENNGDDTGFKVTVDNYDNILVGAGNENTDEIMPIKYSGSGDFIWESAFYGPLLASIHTDDSGDVYLSGTTQYFGTYEDFVLVKYLTCVDLDQDGDPDDSCGGDDCDDENPDTYLGAAEICDGHDNDCDGWIDPGENDDDQDGYRICDDDCDDNNEQAYPGGIEVCDGADNNCDGLTDPEDTPGCIEFYRDQDNDGYGILGDSRCLCNSEGLYRATEPGDCDDQEPLVYPLADESCNGIDDDCDLSVDEEDSIGCTTLYYDGDGDGYGLSEDSRCLCLIEGNYRAAVGGDCNDAVESIHPNATESCNSIDDDCDSEVDEAGSQGCSDYYLDADRDGYGLTGNTQCLCSPEAPYDVQVDGDCDDTDNAIHPGAQEVCNEVDDDCDNQTDEAGAQGCDNYYLDADRDGFGIEEEAECLCTPQAPYDVTVVGDCNDTDAMIYPGALEVCNDVDDDCDGQSDEGENNQGCVDFYLDEDEDGYGVVEDSMCLCHAQDNYSTTAPGDCNDSDVNINPIAEEICNDVDDNCDDIVDPPDSGGCNTYFKDEDGDGFGANGDTRCLCSEEYPYIEDGGGDCDDTDYNVNPSAEEKCNGQDDDCDGDMLEGENEDLDGDEYLGCEDCDDGDPLVNPGQIEICDNGIDDDCDQLIDKADTEDCGCFIKSLAW